MRAEDVYVDPSALTRLYVHQQGSRGMSAWRGRVRGALPVTHHGKTEITNAICQTAYRGALDRDGLIEALDDLASDFANGRLVQPEILWRSALNRAQALSIEHTPTIGTRSLDVLHVACALELGRKIFLTFDSRQQQLAEAVGLKLVRLEVS